MASGTFNIKQNDTGPWFWFLLKDADGVTMDLTGATVKFHLKRGVTVVVPNGVCTIPYPLGDHDKFGGTSDPTKYRHGYYRWQAGDTNTAGAHTCEIEVTLADGFSTVISWPNDSDWNVQITAEDA